MSRTGSARFVLDHVQIAIPRKGEGEARDFYGTLVGLREIPKPESLRSRGGVWFELGTQQLHLGVDESFLPAVKAHPGIACDDLESLADDLESAGFSVTWDEALPGHRRFYTQDPFGNRLEFLATK